MKKPPDRTGVSTRRTGGFGRLGPDARGDRPDADAGQAAFAAQPSTALTSRNSANA